MQDDPAKNESADLESADLEATCDPTVDSNATAGDGSMMTIGPNDIDENDYPEREQTRQDGPLAGSDHDPLMTMDPLGSYDPDLPPQAIETAVPETVNATPPFDVPSAGELLTIGDQEQSQISQLCSKFAAAWDEGNEEPSVEEFVPLDLDPVLRQTLVRQLLVMDMEYRKKKKQESLNPTQYLSRLPDCREAVESAFTQHKENSRRGYGSVSAPSKAKSPNPAKHLLHANDTKTRYRPTDFLARGGLGCVFHAEDEELHRHVALKEIRPDHAANQRLQEKFLFEAEVTASLEHPGIVPIYGLGRYEDDQPYYAMRFIEGKSLNHVINEFHKKHSPLTSDSYSSREFRALLRCLIAACNALHYAHEHGVLHRDIKPDNIMIGSYGETLVVDWGLAKLIDSDSEPEGGSLHRLSYSGSGTRTSVGTAVGTPMYMSPEQAHGRHNELDGRTDVYSLGATLFNIASSRYAVVGDTTRDLVLNIRAGKTRDLNSVVPAAPRALASICRKAMETEVANRYGSALELAEDIDRWMNDDAVRAHLGHETMFERAGRLMRRHKSWTVSVAAALMAITVAAVFAALLINGAKERERIAKEQEQTARAQTQLFKEEAVNRYNDSLDTMETWLVQSSDVLEHLPGASPIRKRLLEIAAADYEKLAQGSSSDPELELARGRALVKLGDLNRMQKDFDAARSQYTSALEVFDAGVEDEDLSIRFRAERGNVLTKLGQAFAGQDMTAEAENEYAAAIDVLEKLSASTNDVLPLRLLAVAYVNAGELQFRMGRNDLAITSFQKGLSTYERLGASRTAHSELGAARTREQLGKIYRDQGLHEKAMIEFNDAIENLDRLVEAHPSHPEYLDALASAYISVADSFRERGLEQQATDALTASLEHYRALTIAMPGTPMYEENLAIALINLGIARHEAGSNKESIKNLTEAENLLLRLVETYPTVPRHRQLLAACMDGLGQSLMDTEEDAGLALQRFARSYKSYEHLIQQEPRPSYVEGGAIAMSHYSQAAARQGMVDDAKANFENAISWLNQLVESPEDAPAYANALAHVHYRYALMLHDQNEAQSLAHFEMARELWSSMNENRTASYANQLAWLLATCPLESIRDAETSRRYAEEAVKMAPENSRFITTLALATLLGGDVEVSQNLLEQSASLRGKRRDRDYFVLAMAQHQSGLTDQALRSFDKGVKAMEENRPFNAELQILRELVSKRMQKQER